MNRALALALLLPVSAFPAGADAPQDELRLCLEAFSRAADKPSAPAADSDAVLAGVCRAVATDSTKPCEPLSLIKGEPETGERMCRRLYLMAKLSRSLAAGRPDAALCASWCAMAPKTPPEELSGRVCAAISKGNYEKACTDISNWLTTPDHGYNVRECRWEMKGLLGLGDAAFCSQHFRPGSDVCVSMGLYKKGKCGDDPLCRALRGEGSKSCEALDKRLAELAKVPAGASTGPSRDESARAAMDCARTRARAVKALGGKASKELNNLEEGFALRSGAAASHLPSTTTFAGAWTLRGERVAVAADGRFLFFSGQTAYAGLLNPDSGRVSGVAVDPSGETPLSGRCENRTSCSVGPLKLKR